MGAEVFVAAAAVGAYSQWQANQAEAKAHRANAAAYAKQKEAAQFAAEREYDIFKGESEAFIGDHISAFARAGVDLSGSALMAIVGDKTRASQEGQAIKISAGQQARLFDIEASQARDEAKRLNSWEHNLLQGGATALQAYSGYLMNTNPKTTTTTTAVQQAEGNKLVPVGNYGNGVGTSTKYGFQSRVR